MGRLNTLKPRVAGLRVGPQTHRIERLRGSSLQKRRHQWFTEHPLCVKCEAAGRVAAATELDHITPLWAGGSDTPSNWQGLCRPCHEAKTAEEARIRGRGG
jgi:5-methylcytosine-specific restriction protein A